MADDLISTKTLGDTTRYLAALVEQLHEQLETRLVAYYTSGGYEACKGALRAYDALMRAAHELEHDRLNDPAREHALRTAHEKAEEAAAAYAAWYDLNAEDEEDEGDNDHECETDTDF